MRTIIQVLTDPETAELCESFYFEPDYVERHLVENRAYSPRDIRSVIRWDESQAERHQRMGAYRVAEIHNESAVILGRAFRLGSGRRNSNGE